MSVDGGTIRAEAELDLTAFTAAARQLEQMSRAIAAEFKAIPPLKPEVDPGTSTAIKSLSSDLRGLVPVMYEVNVSAGRAASSMASFGAALGPVGIAAGAAVIAVGGLSAAMIQAAQGAAQLQHEVAFVQTIKPDIDVRGVTDSLKDLSTSINQTSTQLAQGLYNIFSSVDVTQSEAIQLVEQFAKGAVAARTDAQTFGTAVLGVMNAYKLSVEDAEKISDEFFQTVNAGVVNGQELASSLGLVTQSAKQAGASHEELFAAISAVTKEGGPAAQNINNLSNLFNKMGTAEAAQHMAALGIQTKTLAGNLRDPIEVVGALRDKLSTLTEAERQAAIQVIFPDLQARQGFQVLSSQFAFLQEQLRINREESGQTAAAYKTVAETATEQFGLMQKAMQALSDDIGAALLPALTSIIQTLDGVVVGLRDTTKTFEDAVAQWGPATEEGRAAVQKALAGVMQHFTDAAAEAERQAGRIATALKQATTTSPEGEPGAFVPGGGILPPEQQPLAQVPDWLMTPADQTVGGKAVKDWLIHFGEDVATTVGNIADRFGRETEENYAKLIGPDTEKLERRAAQQREAIAAIISDLAGDIEVQFQALVQGLSPEDWANQSSAIIEAFSAGIKDRIPNITQEQLDATINVLASFVPQFKAQGEALGEAVTAGAVEHTQTLQERMNESLVGINEIFAKVQQGVINVDNELKRRDVTEAYIQNLTNINDQLKENSRLMGEVKDAQVRAHAQWLVNNGDIEGANALLEAHAAAQKATKDAEDERVKAAKKAAEEEEKLRQKQEEALAKLPDEVEAVALKVNDAEQKLAQAHADTVKALGDAAAEFHKRMDDIQRTLNDALKTYSTTMAKLREEDDRARQDFQDKQLERTSAFLAQMNDLTRSALQARTDHNQAVAAAAGELNQTLLQQEQDYTDKLATLNAQRTQSQQQAVDAQSAALSQLSQSLSAIRQQQVQTLFQFSTQLQEIEAKALAGAQTHETQNEIAKARLRLQQEFGLQQAGLTDQEALARAGFGKAVTAAEQQAQRQAEAFAKALAKLNEERDKKEREARDKEQKAIEAADKKLKEELDKIAADRAKAAAEKAKADAEAAKKEERRQEDLARSKKEAADAKKEAEQKAERDRREARIEYDRKVRDILEREDKAITEFQRTIRDANRDLQKIAKNLEKVGLNGNELLREVLRRSSIQMPVTMHIQAIQETGVDFLRVASDHLEARMRQV